MEDDLSAEDIDPGSICPPPKARTLPEADDDGFATVYESPCRRNVAGLRAFNVQGIRTLLAEIRALQDEEGADPHAPLWREVRQSGDYAWTPGPDRRRRVTLYGVTGIGRTDETAANDWIVVAEHRADAAEASSPVPEARDQAQAEGGDDA